MYFSHLVLPRAPEAAMLYSRLVANPYVEHQVLWDMLDAAPDAKRDFLYRSDQTDKGLEIYALSRTPLAPPKPWLARTRSYDVGFKNGQVLQFSLRISPVYDKALGSGKRSVRKDLVMERYAAAEGERSVQDVAQGAAQEWLQARAQSSGFQLLDATASNYQRVVMYKRGAPLGKQPRLDVNGLLMVRDPQLFAQKLSQGYGKSRFAGCGLMLLKRPS